jgi:hypothetical protein
MKKLTFIAIAGVFAATLAASANAEEVIKPLDIKKPVAAAKSTQALPPVSLGLGGLGAGASTGLLIGGIITTIVVIQATSGT